MAVKNTERLTIIMPSDDKALLTELAEQEGRSLCSMVRWLVRKHAAELKTEGASA